jgi:pyruvate dehydrogenase E2 component (dihydrolipoyllysine-residue acetyltransferase)
MPELKMPRLSDSMEEGTIVRWRKRAGDPVAAGDELVEIETDKATVAYEAELAGVLTIVAAEGDTVAVGGVIGRIGSGPGSGPGLGGSGLGAGSDVAVRARASPVARRMALALGVELASLEGTGPGGRIVKSDVKAAVPGPVEIAPPEVRSAAKGTSELIPATAAQSAIARRMALAKSTMPEFTLATEVELDAALELQGQLRGLGLEPAPSLNDFVVKACALALRAHPEVNASYADGGVLRHGRVNVGIAVAAPGVLLVPTLFDADAKSLRQLAVEARTLAERARARTLTPSELAGATFTISNLGMFGITRFTAVLNPPQAAILAVGAGREQVVLRDGAPAAARRLELTLTCDHRVLYGADAARFLQTVRAGLEQPLRLAL